MSCPLSEAMAPNPILEGEGVWRFLFMCLFSCITGLSQFSDFSKLSELHVRFYCAPNLFPPLVRRAAATTTRVAVHRIVAAGPTQRTTIVLVAGPAVAFGRRYPRRGTLGHPQRRESGPSFPSNAGAHFHAGLDASPAHGNVAHAEETDAQRTASQAGPWRTATQEQRGELRRATFPAKAPSCSIASQVPVCIPP